MDVTADTTIALARAEAEKMRAAVTSAAGDATVTMSVDQFAVLSRLIFQLCDLVGGPPGSLGDARYWVPLDIFVKVKAMAARLQQECEDLRERDHGDFTLGTDGFDSPGRL